MADAPQSQLDQVLPETCEGIVTVIATAIDVEPPSSARPLLLPGGGDVGRRITIDATEPNGLLNRCHLSILNANMAPAGEVARVEYEHDKQGKFEARRVYAVQSVRRQAGKLVLLENFIAESPQTVREEDFRPIASEVYAHTVLESLQSWTKYRLWQIQQSTRR